METYFYNRTAYPLLGKRVQVPRCFTDLDRHFGTCFPTFEASLSHDSVMLAENLCRRMADVEFYASQIFDAQMRPNKYEGAVLVGTLLVGYFSACKSLLDAAAVTLAGLYRLDLAYKEMDFSKAKFWKQLQAKVPKVYHQYKDVRGLVREVIEWRDPAVHRTSPPVVVHGPGHPDEVPPKKQEIKMVSQPDAAISDLLSSPLAVPWVEPLYYHKKWLPRFRQLCGDVCEDIRTNT